MMGRAAGRNKVRIALGRVSGSCLCFISLLTISCVRFHPEPISPEVTLDDFEARRLDAPEFEGVSSSPARDRGLAAGVLDS